jgi:hypothetical protein
MDHEATKNTLVGTSKKWPVILLAVIALSGVAFVAGTAARLLLLQPVFLTIRSPDDKLMLRLKGDPTRPMTPIIDHSVYFDLFRNGQPVVANKYLHWGDWFDPSFNDSYRQHDWVTNSVIRFSWESLAGTKCDQLVVRVDTTERINYLYIESKDLFLVFNPGPGSQFTLCAFPQSWKSSMSWVEVEGEFADGKAIPWKGTNFIIDHTPGPFEYQISITSDAVDISSSQLPKYTQVSRPR